jgi:hypothetical protein
MSGEENAPPLPLSLAVEMEDSGAITLEPPPHFRPRVLPQQQETSPVAEAHNRRPHEPPKQTVSFQFYAYKDVDRMINEGYTYPEENSSTICDVVAMYFKGQKILYTEAKTVCEVRLHYLMLPAILITSAAAILSMILKEDQNGPIIVSVLNCVNTFLLTLINYLKLDARAEAHRTAAYKFDKLQSFMEFSSGRMLFDTDAGEKLVEILQKVEHDVREIKETNQFILPEKIRYEYPKLYSTNVFAEVKKIINEEMLHIEQIKTFMNQVLELEKPFREKGEPIDDVTKKRIEEIEAWRRAEVMRVLAMKPRYLGIDSQFDEELQKHRNSFRRCCDICQWLKL